MTTWTPDVLRQKLKKVIDPEVDMNIVDLGLIYDVKYNDGVADIRMTLTSQGCPMEGYITGGVREALGSLEGVKDVQIDLVWEPHWTPEKIHPLALRARETHPKNVTELDVRPILGAGGEPFGAIMGAINKVPEDGALKLISSFKPTPLFGVLGGKGWEHWIEAGDGDQWLIWFFKARPNKKVEAPQVSQAEEDLAHLQRDNAELRNRLMPSDDIWYLDVRRMEPPEPMQLTLEVVEKLPEGITLIQINERTPQFLFEALADRGYKYEVEEVNGEVRTSIRR